MRCQLPEQLTAIGIRRQPVQGSAVDQTTHLIFSRLQPLQKVSEIGVGPLPATGNDALASKIRHRFLEQWVNPDLLLDYSKTFSTYDASEVTKALLTSIEIISRVASEIAEVSEIRFPDEGQSNTLNWLRSKLENQQT